MQKGEVAKMKYRFYLTFQIRYSNGIVAMTECSFDSDLEYVLTTDFEKIRYKKPTQYCYNVGVISLP